MGKWHFLEAHFWYFKGFIKKKACDYKELQMFAEKLKFFELDPEYHQHSCANGREISQLTSCVVLQPANLLREWDGGS